MRSPKDIPVVAIVGRPNVGKSSLFNAIIKQRKAIVHSESGVTRDRIDAVCDYFGKKFKLIDTGGLSISDGEKTNDIWLREIRRQVEIAINSADKIIFMVEAGEPLPLDFDIARTLRASGKKVIVTMNKADNDKIALSTAYFASLGFDKTIAVSCVHRIGIDELLDEICADFKETDSLDEKFFRICIAGRPNVGKSSLLNKLVNDERSLVSDIPGTTRDAIESSVTIKDNKGRELLVSFVDTAGLRQKRKADSSVEIFSIVRTEKSIRNADMVILLLEPFFDGASAQDRRIGGFIKEASKSCILAVNKSDLIKHGKKNELEERIRLTMPFLNYAPLLFISAMKGDGIRELCSKIISIANFANEKPRTSVVNQIISEAQSINPAPNNFKIYYATYLYGTPPRFLLFCNNPKLCTQQYQAFIENSLRKKFPFTGYPIQIILKARKKK